MHREVMRMMMRALSRDGAVTARVVRAGLGKVGAGGEVEEAQEQEAVQLCCAEQVLMTLRSDARDEEEGDGRAAVTGVVGVQFVAASAVGEENEQGEKLEEEMMVVVWDHGWMTTVAGIRTGVIAAALAAKDMATLVREKKAVEGSIWTGPVPDLVAWSDQQLQEQPQQSSGRTMAAMSAWRSRRDSAEVDCNVSVAVLLCCSIRPGPGTSALVTITLARQVSSEEGAMQGGGGGAAFEPASAKTLPCSASGTWLGPAVWEPARLAYLPRHAGTIEEAKAQFLLLTRDGAMHALIVLPPACADLGAEGDDHVAIRPVANLDVAVPGHVTDLLVRPGGPADNVIIQCLFCVRHDRERRQQPLRDELAQQFVPCNHAPVHLAQVTLSWATAVDVHEAPNTISAVLQDRIPTLLTLDHSTPHATATCRFATPADSERRVDTEPERVDVLLTNASQATQHFVQTSHANDALSSLKPAASTMSPSKMLHTLHVAEDAGPERVYAVCSDLRRMLFEEDAAPDHDEGYRQAEHRRMTLAALLYVDVTRALVAALDWAGLSPEIPLSQLLRHQDMHGLFLTILQRFRRSDGNRTDNNIGAGCAALAAFWRRLSHFTPATARPLIGSRILCTQCMIGALFTHCDELASSSSSTSTFASSTTPDRHDEVSDAIDHCIDWICTELLPQLVDATHQWQQWRRQPRCDADAVQEDEEGAQRLSAAFVATVSRSATIFCSEHGETLPRGQCADWLSRLGSALAPLVADGKEDPPLVTMAGLAQQLRSFVALHEHGAATVAHVTWDEFQTFRPVDLCLEMMESAILHTSHDDQSPSSSSSSSPSPSPSPSRSPSPVYYFSIGFQTPTPDAETRSHTCKNNKEHTVGASHIHECVVESILPYLHVACSGDAKRVTHVLCELLNALILGESSVNSLMDVLPAERSWAAAWSSNYKTGFQLETDASDSDEDDDDGGDDDDDNDDDELVERWATTGSGGHAVYGRFASIPMRPRIEVAALELLAAIPLTEGRAKAHAVLSLLRCSAAPSSRELGDVVQASADHVPAFDRQELLSALRMVELHRLLAYYGIERDGFNMENATHVQRVLACILAETHRGITALQDGLAFAHSFVQVSAARAVHTFMVNCIDVALEQAACVSLDVVKDAHSGNGRNECVFEVVDSTVSVQMAIDAATAAMRLVVNAHQQLPGGWASAEVLTQVAMDTTAYMALVCEEDGGMAAGFYENDAYDESGGHSVAGGASEQHVRKAAAARVVTACSLGILRVWEQAQADNVRSNAARQACSHGQRHWTHHVRLQLQHAERAAHLQNDECLAVFPCVLADPRQCKDIFVRVASAFEETTADAVRHLKRIASLLSIPWHDAIRLLARPLLARGQPGIHALVALAKDVFASRTGLNQSNADASCLCDAAVALCRYAVARSQPETLRNEMATVRDAIERTSLFLALSSARQLLALAAALGESLHPRHPFGSGSFSGSSSSSFSTASSSFHNHTTQQCVSGILRGGSALGAPAEERTSLPVVVHLLQSSELVLSVLAQGIWRTEDVSGAVGEEQGGADAPQAPSWTTAGDGLEFQLPLNSVAFSGWASPELATEIDAFSDGLVMDPVAAVPKALKYVLGNAAAASMAAATTAGAARTGLSADSSGLVEYLHRHDSRLLVLKALQLSPALHATDADEQHREFMEAALAGLADRALRARVVNGPFAVGSLLSLRAATYALSQLRRALFAAACERAFDRMHDLAEVGRQLSLVLKLPLESGAAFEQAFQRLTGDANWLATFARLGVVVDARRFLQASEAAFGRVAASSDGGDAHGHSDLSTSHNVEGFGSGDGGGGGGGVDDGGDGDEGLHGANSSRSHSSLEAEAEALVAHTLHGQQLRGLLCHVLMASQLDLDLAGDFAQQYSIEESFVCATFLRLLLFGTNGEQQHQQQQVHGQAAGGGAGTDESNANAAGVTAEEVDGAEHWNERTLVLSTRTSALPPAQGWKGSVSYQQAARNVIRRLDTEAVVEVLREGLRERVDGTDHVRIAFVQEILHDLQSQDADDVRCADVLSILRTLSLSECGEEAIDVWALLRSPLESIQRIMTANVVDRLLLLAPPLRLHPDQLHCALVLRTASDWVQRHAATGNTSLSTESVASQLGDLDALAVSITTPCTRAECWCDVADLVPAQSASPQQESATSIMLSMRSQVLSRASEALRDAVGLSEAAAAVAERVQRATELVVNLQALCALPATPASADVSAPASWMECLSGSAGDTEDFVQRLVQEASRRVGNMFVGHKASSPFVSQAPCVPGTDVEAALALANAVHAGIDSCIGKDVARVLPVDVSLEAVPAAALASGPELGVFGAMPHELRAHSDFLFACRVAFLVAVFGEDEVAVDEFSAVVRALILYFTSVLHKTPSPVVEQEYAQRYRVERFLCEVRLAKLPLQEDHFVAVDRTRGVDREEQRSACVALSRTLWRDSQRDPSVLPLLVLVMIDGGIEDASLWELVLSALARAGLRRLLFFVLCRHHGGAGIACFESIFARQPQLWRSVASAPLEDVQHCASSFERAALQPLQQSKASSSAKAVEADQEESKGLSSSTSDARNAGVAKLSPQQHRSDLSSVLEVHPAQVSAVFDGLRALLLGWPAPSSSASRQAVRETVDAMARVPALANEAARVLQLLE